ncbi:MAG: hypothetical protein RMJ35_12440, partial [Phycisphaerales bacterium]|nr:hypothetical protein [Phycisphaerales bacterium]
MSSASVELTSPPPPANLNDSRGLPPMLSRSKSASRRSRSVFVIYLLLSLGAVMFLIPFYFVVNGSLKTDPEVQADR